MAKESLTRHANPFRFYYAMCDAVCSTYVDFSLAQFHIIPQYIRSVDIFAPNRNPIIHWKNEFLTH